MGIPRQSKVTGLHASWGNVSNRTIAFTMHVQATLHGNRVYAQRRVPKNIFNFFYPYQHWSKKAFTAKNAKNICVK